MSWATWIFFAAAGFIAILAISYVLLSLLNMWFNKEFCDDKE
jgi:hypothetical protein